MSQQLSKVAGLILSVLTCHAVGQEVTPPAETPPPATQLILADTEIHLRLLEPVASNTHKRGDHFKLELVDNVMVGDVVVIPAGSQGEGEVVHAAKPGMAGRAGELILVSRFVQVGDEKVKLRSFSAGTGQNRLNLATGLGATLGPVGLFVTGKNIALPAGTDVYAKISSDTQLSSSPVQPIQEANKNESPQESK